MAVQMTRRRLLAGLTAAPVMANLASSRALGAGMLDTPDFTYKGAVRLNSNENALGMSPRAKEAIAGALVESNRYPDARYKLLKDVTATHLNVSTNNLLLTNGSAEILTTVAQMAEREGGKVIAPKLTFETVARTANIINMAYETVPMGPGFSIDLAALEQAALASDRPVLVYLVSPNNPTGTLAASADIKAWIKRAPDHIFFLVDEAYHDYVDDPRYESMISLVKDGYKNLIVARTFSKIYALAGLRVGYGVAQPDTLNRIGVLMPYGNVNLLGIAAAVASINDVDWAPHSKAMNARSKAILLDAFAQLGLKALPSQANFVFHQINAPLAAYQAHMRAAGYLVGRPFGGLDNWNRLSLATPSEMERFAETLITFRSKGWV